VAGTGVDSNPSRFQLGNRGQPLVLVHGVTGCFLVFGVLAAIGYRRDLERSYG